MELARAWCNATVANDGVNYRRPVPLSKQFLAFRNVSSHHSVAPIFAFVVWRSGLAIAAVASCWPSNMLTAIWRARLLPLNRVVTCHPVLDKNKHVQPSYRVQPVIFVHGVIVRGSFPLAYVAAVTGVRLDIGL